VRPSGAGRFSNSADLSPHLTDAATAAIARRTRVQQAFGFDAELRALRFDVQPDR
jgi:predicted nucleic acid-binding protein